MMPVSMSMCLYDQCCLWSCPGVCVSVEDASAVHVASIHVNVHVFRAGSMLPLFIFICMRLEVNFASVLVHVLGRSMLPLLKSIC